MSRISLDKIVAAKYQFLENNKILPAGLQISQTFANSMAEELMRDVGRTIRGKVRCRIHGDCWLFGMKVRINPNQKADFYCMKSPPRDIFVWDDDIRNGFSDSQWASFKRFASQYGYNL